MRLKTESRFSLPGDGQPDMQMYGSTAPPTAAQVPTAAQLVQQTDASLKRYANVQAAFAAGYTYVLKTNGEEHLLYDGPNFTRWHSHLVTCVNGQQVIAGFGVQLRGGCDPATWQDRYTAQMLHVWVVPYPGGV